VQLQPLSLVIGGAASGKSRWAEGLVSATGRPRHYIATATAGDAGMQAKITRHQQARGAGWATQESPLDLAGAIEHLPADAVGLVDCMTMWLTNHLLAGSDIDRATTDLLEAIGRCPAPLVLVTNEVGTGGIPENALARQFQALQGQLNQSVAAQAGLVVAVIAGLPMVLKGALPEGRT